MTRLGFAEVRLRVLASRAALAIAVAAEARPQSCAKRRDAASFSCRRLYGLDVPFGENGAKKNKYSMFTELCPSTYPAYIRAHRHAMHLCPADPERLGRMHARYGYPMFAIEVMKLFFLTAMSCHWLACLFLAAEGSITTGFFSYSTKGACAQGEHAQAAAAHSAPSCAPRPSGLSYGREALGAGPRERVVCPPALLIALVLVPVAPGLIWPLHCITRSGVAVARAHAHGVGGRKGLPAVARKAGAHQRTRVIRVFVLSLRSLHGSSRAVLVYVLLPVLRFHSRGIIWVGGVGW